jgi:HPt (histidine-containing phosphotransfer) domain-containing protein
MATRPSPKVTQAQSPQVKITRSHDHELIQPANMLKRRAGVVTDGPPGIDETAIRRAEQALKALAPQFNGWMEDAVRKLDARWKGVKADGFGEGRLAAFHREAHDIRGQATTLGFPLCSRVGESLCMLIEEAPAERLGDEHVMILVGQHVDAIRAIMREGITQAPSPIGNQLAEQLEQVAGHTVAMFKGAKPH